MPRETSTQAETIGNAAWRYLQPKNTFILNQPQLLFWYATAGYAGYSHSQNHLIAHNSQREKNPQTCDKFCPLKCYIVKWWVILHGTRRAIFPVQTPPSGRHIPCKSGCTMPLVVVTRCCLLTFVGILRQWEHICLSGKSELFISFVAGCQLLWSLLLHQGSFLKMQVAVGHEIQSEVGFCSDSGSFFMS